MQSSDNNAQDSDKIQEESIDEPSPPVHCLLCSVQVIQMCRNHCFAFDNSLPTTWSITPTPAHPLVLISHDAFVSSVHWSVG